MFFNPTNDRFIKATIQCGRAHSQIEHAADNTCHRRRIVRTTCWGGGTRGGCIFCANDHRTSERHVRTFFRPFQIVVWDGPVVLTRPLDAKIKNKCKNGPSQNLACFVVFCKTNKFIFFSIHGSQFRFSIQKTIPHSFSSKTVPSEFIFCRKRTRNSIRKIMRENKLFT